MADAGSASRRPIIRIKIPFPTRGRIEGNLHNPVVEADIQAVAEQFKLAVSTEDMPIVNWNKTWESNFDPIIIDDICTIYATFHKIEISTPYAIEIAPKMAFGTGHHATTYMMIAEMMAMG